MAVRNLNHGKLLIKGAGSGQSHTIPIEVGNLKWTEAQETHRIHARQTQKEYAVGRDQPCEVSFTIAYEAYRGDGTEVTPVDALTKSGGAASWTSQEASGPYAVELEFQITSPDTTKHEKVVFPDFHHKSIEVSEDEDFNKIVVTGESKATRPTVTRVTSF